MFLKLIKESFLFAMQAVILNKLRTFLSLLGITIGIFAIISVFTILDWMESSIRDNIASLGDKTIYIDKMPWGLDMNVDWMEIMKRPAPSIREYEELKGRLKNAEALAFLVQSGVTVKYRNNSAENIEFLSSTYDFADIRSFEIEKGRYYSLFESRSGKNRAIIGAVLAEKLFENANPVGKTITIRGKKLKVVGVLKKEGMGGLGDDGFDRAVLVPINFTKSIINLRSKSLHPLILVKAREDVPITELREDLVANMRSIRKLKPDEKDNFALNQADLIAQSMDAVFSGINLGGWIIGGFSILVGGFGIANIMFVSVKERTKIIGIQKALGAKKIFILQEFLYESILLSLVGGIFGLILVFSGTIVMRQLWDLNITLTFGNIFMAMLISGTIGIISGFAPAQSASSLDPVEAMGATF